MSTPHQPPDDLTGRSTGAYTPSGDQRGVVAQRAATDETKSAFKTTEFIVYVAITIGVLIACWVIDVKEDGQRFSGYQGWFLVTLLTVGYMISRGLAKSGSRHNQ